MTIELEPSLERWVEARILDREQADRIRQWETQQAPRHRARWPVVIAVTFGGIMLAAGALLFVSAHWDQMSPLQRMTLLVSAVGLFHVGGALSLERFHALGVTLHAVGTVALGGAIAMAGQIFNMQEHWPTATLLWALGAVAGWLLLRDWPHLALAAILLPFWVAAEYSEDVLMSQGAALAMDSGCLLLAICYFTVRVPGAEGRHAHVRTALTWLGGFALLPATLVVALNHAYFDTHTTGAGALAIGWSLAMLLPLALAWVFRRNAAWMNVVAAIWVVGLGSVGAAGESPLVYAWCGIGAAGMVGWGLYESRAERVNLGMAGFAITIIWFFFSSVMDRLDRSLSLIVLGILFLGGGWAGEKLRRKLVAGLATGGVQ